MTPNLQVPATAEGMPNIRRRAVLIGAALPPAAPRSAHKLSNGTVIPSWMELKIEVHRAALADLDRQSRTLKTLSVSTPVSGAPRPSAWIADAERAHAAAMDRETRAMSALLAERSRARQDSQARDRYLAALSVNQPNAFAAITSSTKNGGN